MMVKLKLIPAFLHIQVFLVFTKLQNLEGFDYLYYNTYAGPPCGALCNGRLWYGAPVTVGYVPYYPGILRTYFWRPRWWRSIPRYSNPVDLPVFDDGLNNCSNKCSDNNTQPDQRNETTPAPFPKPAGRSMQFEPHNLSETSPPKSAPIASNSEDPPLGSVAARSLPWPPWENPFKPSVSNASITTESPLDATEETKAENQFSEEE